MENHSDRMEETATEPMQGIPDTFLDPARTTFWTVDNEHSGHIVQEITQLDEKEKTRSAPLAFLNAILFLLMLCAILFCFFETGLLKYLLR